MKHLDYSEPIQISDHVHWVGTYDHADNFQCNSYLLIVDDKGIVIDPGSLLYFESLMGKLSRLIELKKISYVVAQHQDPDVCGNIVQLMAQIRSAGNDSCKVITHSRTYVLMRHYGGDLKFEYSDKLPNRRFMITDDLWLDFIHTPYLHAPGAIATYFDKDKILFSSDLFGGMTDNWQLFAKEDYFSEITSFHKDYMPSKEILLFAITQFEKFDIETVAPQHGSVIIKDRVREVMEAFKDFECGLFIDQKFLDELRAARKKIEEQNKIMNEELSMAAHFQQSLLPQKTSIRLLSPNIDISFFYRPYSQVSGDFLITEMIDSTRLGILVVDVVDHGVTAGLATIQIKTLFDEYKKTAPSAAAFLQTINERAFSISSNDIFFTALYAVFDIEDSTINIASAGAVPPIHFTARNEAATVIPLIGTPLGVCQGDECIIQETQVPVEKDDVFIFQTDGLIDCPNSNDEPFERIKSQTKIVKQIRKNRDSKEILDAIVEEANLHMGEHKAFEDDVTLTVLKKC